jgi:predicted DsbA family dithiol-disulfide isomerase
MLSLMYVSVDIVSDTICPWCFIGKRRFEAALARRPEVEVAVSWRTFQLNPDMPPEGMDRREYVAQKWGDPARAEGVYDNIRAAGAGENIAFDFPAIRRTPNTVDSHRLIRLAGSVGLQDRVVERLFSGFFSEGVDIGDRDSLLRLASDAGMDRELVDVMFADEDSADAVRQEDAAARAMGVNAVPCFIFARKYVIFGAQEADSFLQLFDHMAREGEAGGEPLEAAPAEA